MNVVLNETPDENEDTEVFLVSHDKRNFLIERDGFMRTNYKPTTRYDGRYYYVFPLFSYIHGGIALSISNGYPFDCRWDGGQTGYVFVAMTEVKGRDNAKQLADSLVEEWNDYLSGNVWGFVITRPDECELCNHIQQEDVESCWGFVGDYTHCLNEARAIVDTFIPEGVAA